MRKAREPSESCRRLFSPAETRQNRRRVGREVTIWLVLALVMSRLDYCYSRLSGLPASTVNILQRVQNAAPCLICNLKPCEHVTALFKQLHWLPVKQRVQYKLCIIMYSIQFGLAPLYITELVSCVAAQTSRPGLRSADTTNYVQPQTRTKFGERAFSYCWPSSLELATR